MALHDSIQNTIGSFGWYQMYIGIILYCTTFIEGFSNFALKSFLHTVPYRCGNSTDFNTCPCKIPIFIKTDIESSPITEWNLICDKSYIIRIIYDADLYGTFLGTFIVGFISDRFGRQKALLISTALLVLSSFGSALTTHLWIYVILRCLLTVSLCSLKFICYALMIEITGVSHRYLVTLLVNISSFSGLLIFTILNIQPNNFRKFLLLLAMPVPLLINCFMMILESPRWLILNRKNTDAIIVLQKIAEINNRPRAGIIIKVGAYRKKLNDYDVNCVSYKNIFKCLVDWYVLKSMLLISLSMLVCTSNFTIMRVYIKWNVYDEHRNSDFKNEILINCSVFLISTIIGIPFMILGRRNLCIFFIIISSLCVALEFIFDRGSEYDFMKFMTTAAIATARIYLQLYFLELVPTLIRTCIQSIVVFFYSIIMANLKSALESEFFINIISSLNIFVGTMSALLLLTLPDTRDHRIISTLGEEVIFNSRFHFQTM